MKVVGHYLFNFWGRDADDVAAKLGPALCRRIGDKGDRAYYVWFDTAEARDEFREAIKGAVVIHHPVDGPRSHIRHRAEVRVRMPDGKEYDVSTTYLPHKTQEEADSHIGYHWREGNYSCDCNRAIFVNCKYKTDYSEECGEESALLKLTVVDICCHTGKELDRRELELE